MISFWTKIKKPIVGLSPMDGVTDFPMREIQCEIAKPDVIFTEFISAEGFVRNPGYFQKHLYFTERQRPIVAQVFGYTPPYFYETVSQLMSLGFDGIDINMGCPSRKVLGKGGGGALIGNFKLTEEIMCSCLKAIENMGNNIPLSVKTRIGKKEFETESWINFLTKFPISAVTVHGRLLKQRCNGPVFWQEVQKASKILKSKNIICLGNGGVKDINEAEELALKFELDGILIGQSSLGNPWVFLNNYFPQKEEIIETIIEHARKVEEFYPKERFVTVLKHFSWYPRGFEGCKSLKRELLKTRSLDQVLAVVEKYR